MFSGPVSVTSSVSLNVTEMVCGRVYYTLNLASNTYVFFCRPLAHTNIVIILNSIFSLRVIILECEKNCLQLHREVIVGNILFMVSFSADEQICLTNIAFLHSAHTKTHLLSCYVG